MGGLTQWLQQAAWPLWLAHGVDWRARAFHESLTLEGRDCAAEFRRLRVVARQVYVFSQAHRHGVPRAAEAVELGVEFLRRRAALPGGGYAWRFGLDGRVLDARIDLYDQAFVLLALSAATAVLPAAALRPLALALDGFIERNMAHPAGGYVESLPPALPRRQNPHMHLLEARLAAAEAFPDAGFLARAEPLAALLRQHLLRREPGGWVLGEFYGEDWGVVPPVVVEPGHHCEWVWLLHWHARLAARPVAEEAVLLRDFLDRHLPPGPLPDGLSPEGAVVAPGARLWPQAERLKAEALRQPADAARRADAEQALRRYLRPDGLWHERILPDGQLSEEPAPASSLYHLTCGILEAAQALPPVSR